MSVCTSFYLLRTSLCSKSLSGLMTIVRNHARSMERESLPGVVETMLRKVLWVVDGPLVQNSAYLLYVNIVSTFIVS